MVLEITLQCLFILSCTLILKNTTGPQNTWGFLCFLQFPSNQPFSLIWNWFQFEWSHPRCCVFAPTSCFNQLSGLGLLLVITVCIFLTYYNTATWLFFVLNLCSLTANWKRNISNESRKRCFPNNAHNHTSVFETCSEILPGKCWITMPFGTRSSFFNWLWF